MVFQPESPKKFLPAFRADVRNSVFVKDDFPFSRFFETVRFIVGEQKRDVFFKRIIGVFDFLFHFVALEFVPFADKLKTLVVFARWAESAV